MELGQNQIGEFPGAAQVSQRYFTRGRGTVNQHVSDAAQPLDERGARRYIAHAWQRNVAGCARNEARFDLQPQIAQRVPCSAALPESIKRRAEEDPRADQHPSETSAEISKTGRRRERGDRRSEAGLSRSIE